MPSQATSYLYTIVAMGVVALIVTNAFKIQIAGLKAVSDRHELRELLEAVATEATELIAFTEATNATAKVSLQIPTLIGDKEYWVRLHSDAAEAWVEGAFGEPWAGNPDFRVELPGGVRARHSWLSGFFIGKVSEGNFASGFKYAALLALTSYVTLILSVRLVMGLFGGLL